MRRPEDAYLVLLRALSLAAASFAYLARHNRWRGWIGLHIPGMGASYILLLTAFYVDDGPRFRVRDWLPVLAFWTVPSLIGFPFVVRARVRYRGGPLAPPVRTLERPVAL
jgi:hypothetical protein